MSDGKYVPGGVEHARDFFEQTLLLLALNTST
jgi:hypothetical protein